jgi:hypothetical protein
VLQHLSFDLFKGWNDLGLGHHQLFRPLDQEWQSYARQAEQDGLDLLVPPVLGIVLTRCAQRDAIPTVIRDLRDEWADARKKVWDLLYALRRCSMFDVG